MKRLEVQHFGPIEQGTVEPGDLTIFVGPQASGKSIFLQLFKLLLDAGSVQDALKKYSFTWNGNPKAFLSLYFGEGMEVLFSEKTSITLNGKPKPLESLLKARSKPEKVFYIPAQRVLCVQGGWPRPFMDFSVGDPFVMRHFSEHLRRLMESGIGGEGGTIFPQEHRLSKSLRNALVRSIYYEGELALDQKSMRKRIVLKRGESLLPIMTWSTGQREFMPLLLGFYWLMPSSKISKKKELEWVVIEEPEMGLHPEAIQAFLLLVLEMMRRGYQILISTHSPMVLDLVWTLRNLKAANDPENHLFRLFQLKKTPRLREIFQCTLQKRTIKTYFFRREGTGGAVIKDISDLDPYSEREFEADWGGLTAFTSRSSEVLSEVFATNE